MLSSLLSSSAYAESINYSIEVAPVLNLTIPTSTINLSLNPNTKDFDSQDLSITVGTNNTWGYQLSMSSTTTSLVNTEDDTVTIETLPTLAGGYTTDTFEDNKWGYKKDGGNYFPYENTTLLESDTAAANDTTTLNFAAKVNYNQPAGNYTMSLSFNAVAKVAPPTMQNLDGSLCTITPTTAIDTRDGNLYTITRLPDGNCWMTKNLDLPGGTTLTPANSNVTANYTLPESSTTGFSDNSTAYVYNSHSSTCADNSPCYSYYSYSAATAGTGASLATGEATSDICPKGWRLPTQAEYQTLVSAYDTGALLATTPFLGVYGGYYHGSSFSNGGTHGFYWSSTVYDISLAYRLGYNTDGAASMLNVNKKYGFSVRCILNPPTNLSEITTMQQASSTIAGNTANGATATLRDTRDNKQYTVAKIDGLIWMTKNLDLAGGTPLYSDTSNVPAGYPSTGGTAFYTLPASSTEGFSDNTQAYVYNSGGTACSSDDPCYSYYSYAAATAGTNPSAGDTEADICPSGWRLPTQAEYNNLVSTYNTATLLINSPFLGVYSGCMTNSLYANGGKIGGHWASTTDDASNAYFMNYSYNGNSSSVLSANKRFGIGIRCVMEGRTNLEKLQANSLTMQGIGNLSSSERSTLFSQMTAGTSYNTVDTRNGGTSYTIAKIGDQVWMTKNLDLAGGTPLYSDTSNVPAGYPSTGGTAFYTLPASSTSGFDDASGAYVYNSGSTTCSSSESCYSYYSYAVTTAGINPTSSEATSDICPKGWRLPTDTELTTLKNTYTNGALLVASPFLGVYAGGYGDSTFLDGDIYGNYWSSVPSGSDSSKARYLYFKDTAAGVSSISRKYGLSVRCLAKS